MINIKAQQTLVKFSKTDAGTLRYVMRPEKYSLLSESKVINEASVRSGIAKGALKLFAEENGQLVEKFLTCSLFILPLPMEMRNNKVFSDN